MGHCMQLLCGNGIQQKQPAVGEADCKRASVWRRVRDGNRRSRELAAHRANAQHAIPLPKRGVVAYRGEGELAWVRSKATSTRRRGATS